MNAISRINKVLNKLLSTLFSTRAAGVYILVFALSIGAATFIENDYGTSSSQKVVFRTWWFASLLALFCMTIIVNIFRFRMIQQKKWALLTFHLAMVIILFGSAVTRFTGFEGIMHIRESHSSNSFLSSETYLLFNVMKNDNVYQFEEPVLFGTLGSNRFHESYLIGNDLIEVSVKEFIPNPVEKITDDPAGKPTIKIVFGGGDGREEYYLAKGQIRQIRNVTFNFKDTLVPDAVNILFRGDSLLFQSDRAFTRRVMATQQEDTLYPDGFMHPLKLRALYSDGTNRFAFGDFKPKGTVHIESENAKVKNESMTALRLEVKINNASRELLVYGQQGAFGNPGVIETEKLGIAVSYGSKETTLPFSIKLNDFIMDRYPGTNNPISFASEVQLIDPRKNLNENYRIYMNHVLDYEGYRFFQSSYDNDERGTYLSVNHDFWGTWISYTGYFLLTVGMVLSLLSRRSRFHRVSELITEIRKENKAALRVILLVSLFAPSLVFAQKVIDPVNRQYAVDATHAEIFSRLVVQDQNGRMKPLHTLSREILRKLARTESMFGLNADQVVLGMFANNMEWTNVPMIKVGSNEAILKLLGVPGTMAAYRDFFDNEGRYRLQDEIHKANGMQPRDRGVFEKELIKIDERVNISNMIFSGHIFKIIPVPNDPNNTWESGHLTEHTHSQSNQSVAERFFDAYRSSLREAMDSRDYSIPNSLVNELAGYQKQHGTAVMPSASQINTEIVLNKLDIFNRLSIVYTLLGLSFLFFLFLSVFKPGKDLKTIYKILFALVIAGFAFHSIGLGMRWYVSGRAPWSNGYESMIYIGWTTVLAGIVFTRKSFGGLAATMVLAATVLSVAHLSYLDPEITPLVPVLRSYWLTIHVSMEAGSYGFLMLGAIIGLINLILMIFLKQKNETAIHRRVREMTYLSEMTLTGGLMMLSIGTYLGGVWANESWGRYWGWDAKETWALVSILVYAFILHMRLIPGLKGIFAFNLATIFGLASIIMTYFGVNYYLSGLHSYAAGDPVPIPNWVYIAVTMLVLISVTAYIKIRRFRLFR